MCGNRGPERDFLNLLPQWPFGICEICEKEQCDVCDGVFDKGVCIQSPLCANEKMCTECVIKNEALIAFSLGQP
jgi:hypothetical protein